ncbi:MAG: flagellar biosynthesis protein FliQ [Planctomycetota bacterium]
MSPADATEIGRQALLTTLLLGLPVMGCAVVVGLAMSIFQAVTQLQDQTLGFVPKIVAMLAVLLYTLPWMIDLSVSYTRNLFESIGPSVLGGY